MRRSCRCRSICRAAGLNRQSLSSPGAGPEDVRQVGDRIRRAVAETSVEDGHLRVGVTVSLGGATFRESSDSTDSLVALADGALYQAKEGGRNRLVVGLVRGGLWFRSEERALASRDGPSPGAVSRSAAGIDHAARSSRGDEPVRNGAIHTEGSHGTAVWLSRQKRHQITCELQARKPASLTSSPYFWVSDDRASRWCDGVASPSRRLGVG